MADFAKILAEQQEGLRVSNLTNLASAHVQASEYLGRLDKRMSDVRAHMRALVEAGQNENIHVDEVRALYSKRWGDL